MKKAKPKVQDTRTWSKEEIDKLMSIHVMSLEQQKTDVMKQIFTALDVPWDEKGWKRITSLTKEGSYAQGMVLDHQTENEKHLCTFDIKFQKDGLYLDVQSKYLN